MELTAARVILATSPVTHAARPRRESTRFRLAVIVMIVALSAAVNSGSLWIDEGFSAWLACHRGFVDLARSLATGDSSDLQMPLYAAYLWAWVKLFGAGEFALRAANLPWTALFVIALALASRLALGRSFAWMAVALSPFVWSYTNEARAYLPMLACATATLSALLIYAFGPSRYRKRAPWPALGFFALALMLHMLAALLLPAIVVIVLVCARRAWIRDWRWPLLVFAPLFVLLGCYFWWTFARGTAYEYGRPGWPYLLFALYEFAGFAGLGPNRNQLRIHADWATLGRCWPWLLAGAAALALAITNRPRPRANLLLGAWCASFAVAASASLAIDSRFLGRHLAALLPLFLLWIIARNNNPRRLACLALLWAVSDVRLAMLPEYRKDDYRAAVQFIVDQHAQSIAWAADPITASYYGLRLTDPNQARYYAFDYTTGMRRVTWATRAAGVAAANWNPSQTAAFFANAPRPAVLALSKPDLYDVHNGWLPLLNQRRLQPVARFQSFDIYRIP